MQPVRKLVSLALSGVAFCTAAAAGASGSITQELTIGALGSHGGIGYVIITAPQVGACAGNHVYFLVNDLAGQATLSLLLTARASGRPLTRLDYSTDAQGVCWISLVQI